MELAQHTGRVSLRTDSRVTALLTKSPGRAVRVWALDPCMASSRCIAQGCVCPKESSGAVIQQPLDALGQFVQQPDAFNHQADTDAVDPADRCHPGDRVVVAAVQVKAMRCAADLKASEHHLRSRGCRLRCSQCRGSSPLLAVYLSTNWPRSFSRAAFPRNQHRCAHSRNPIDIMVQG